MRRSSLFPKPTTTAGETPRFWTADSHSIQTTRQFNLLRGKPIKAALDILQAENSRRRRRMSEDSGLDDDGSPPPDDDTLAPPAAVALLVAPGGAARASSPKPPPLTSAQKQAAVANFVNAKTQQFNWDWPLGQVKIVNTDERFEIRIPLGPFQESEVWVSLPGDWLVPRFRGREPWVEGNRGTELCPITEAANPFQASVVGNELSVYLDATARDDDLGLGNRERMIQRKYTLPLNVDPQSAEFKVINKTMFRVSIEKDRPVKLALCGIGDETG